MRCGPRRATLRQGGWTGRRSTGGRVPAKDGVLAVQVRRLGICDEELGQVAVGALVGHGDDAPRVVLVAEVRWEKGMAGLSEGMRTSRRDARRDKETERGVASCTHSQANGKLILKWSTPDTCTPFAFACEVGGEA